MAQKMTKEDKYEINQRNGFYMWAYNASINTVNNIQRVKDGEIWVPMYDDVRLKPCPKPPLKSFVQRAVEKALQEKEEWRLQQKSEIEQGNLMQTDELMKAIKRPYVLDMTSSHSPDIEWLLVVLSTLQPNHRYFSKSYYPSDEELGGRGIKVKPKDNQPDEFFDNLPEHLSKAKYSRKAPANERQANSENESQIHSESVGQRNRDQQEIEKLKKQVQDLTNQKNGFVKFGPFNQDCDQHQYQNKVYPGFQNQSGNSNSMNFPNNQNHQQRSNHFQNFSGREQQQMNSNSSTFGNVFFKSVYENQNDSVNQVKNQQQNISKKQEAINTLFNSNPNQTKKIIPQILSLKNPEDNLHLNTNNVHVDTACQVSRVPADTTCLGHSQIIQNDNANKFQFPTVSPQIYQTGSKFTNQFYAKEKSPRQTPFGNPDQTTCIYESQSHSVQVTPTKVKMSKVQIVFQDTTEGANQRQISHSEVKENQAPNIKDNFMVNNIIVQSSNGESSNQVDFKSLKRMLTNYPEHLQQQLIENQNQ